MREDMKGSTGWLWSLGVFVLMAAFAAWLITDSKSTVSAQAKMPAVVPKLIPLSEGAKISAAQDMRRYGFIGAYWSRTTLVVPAITEGESLESVGHVACANLRVTGYVGPADVQFVDRVAIRNKTLKQLARVRCQ